MKGTALPVDSSTRHLRWRLESWLQVRFGPRAVLTALPMRIPPNANNAEMATFVWLEILADDIGAPSAAGIRRVSGRDQVYEIVEWSGPRTLRRSLWLLEGSSGWRKL